MRILITGICGFVGSTLARAWLEAEPGVEICGLDHLGRAGSELNRSALRQLGVKVFHGDIRVASDFESLPKVDWVIDAAANPSVLAGVDGTTSSRQLIEHNLWGTVNILEYCKRHGAGFILVSTSRVYSIAPLAEAPVEERDGAFHLAPGPAPVPGLSPAGVSELFSTAPPISLYGSSKLASETLALEYGETFGFPVWINSWLRRAPLSYIGFGGRGHQVRDCLQPRDLIPLLRRQTAPGAAAPTRLVNLGGGRANAMSLAQLSAWCRERYGEHPVAGIPEMRRFDIPWLIMDSSLAGEIWDWRPETGLEAVLDQIARHAEANPHWLEISGVA